MMNVHPDKASLVESQVMFDLQKPNSPFNCVIQNACPEQSFSVVYDSNAFVVPYFKAF